MTLGQRVDPVPTYWFEVDMGIPGLALVRSISGLGEKIEKVELWEGGASMVYHSLPGKRSWPNLVLKGVVVDDLSLFAWFTSVRIEALVASRRMLSIFLKRSDGEIMANWNVVGAYPLSYNGPSFDANTSAIAFESIELTHMGIVRDM
jgi:phage tail-like protein